MLAFGVGVMGLSLDDFLDLTPFQFTRMIKAWGEQNELREKVRWEQARYLAYAMVIPHLDSKKPNTPQSVFPLPWDKKPEPAKQSSKERFEELKRKWR
jgi:hypothetical protein